jgi:hypothetical protein
MSQLEWSIKSPLREILNRLKNLSLDTVEIMLKVLNKLYCLFQGALGPNQAKQIGKLNVLKKNWRKI